MTSTVDLSREVPERIDAEVDVAVIGAGAAGIVCALRAADGGAEVAVFERDPSPAGSTSMSSGFIPAAGTRFQRAANIADDSAGLFEADIMAKSHGRSDPRLARLATRSIAAALEWLDDEAGLEWIVLDDFLYPGHSRHRMHAVPERTGEALMSRLLAADAFSRLAASRMASEDDGEVRAEWQAGLAACTADGQGGQSS